jgi:hypothetical protein
MTVYNDVMYGGAPDECDQHWPKKPEECGCGIIEAIRNHPQLGVGSCHPWDECYTDAELLELLDGKTEEEALQLGLAILDVFDDRFADARNSEF